LSLDKLFSVTFLKSVFLGFSNKNTLLIFLKKKLLSYAVQHCRLDNNWRIVVLNGMITIG